MLNPRWFLRMKRWQQNPPSLSRVLLVLGIVAVCLCVAMIEAFIGWPQWMTAEPMPGGRSFQLP
ncbi:MAG: hypothetical protein AAFU80_01595 [Pseudomonadota bacterium]